MIRFIQLLLAGTILAASPVGAGEWEFSGDLGFEARYFGDDPAYPGQEQGFGASLELNFGAHRYGDNSRVSIEPFLRLDSTDSRRSHFDLREAYWAREGNGWELLAGFNRVFWGVTESRHLVDIVNQSDLVEDLDQERKLGQPMVSLSLEQEWGLLEFFAMPWFRERTYPGAHARLRTPLPIDTDAAEFESSAGRRHTDLALRWSHYFGDIDIGLHAFHGTGREPALFPSCDGQRLVPFYHGITQFGVDLQYTRDAWLWKLEAIGRNGLDDRFFAAVAGFEYTFYGINGGASDLGVLLEYLHDGRAPGEPPAVFDDDLFVGARWALNDIQDTSLLTGIVWDRDKSEWFFNLEAERRIGDDLTLEARVRLFNTDASGQLQPFERDDYVELSLARYF